MITEIKDTNLIAVEIPADAEIFNKEKIAVIKNNKSIMTDAPINEVKEDELKSIKEAFLEKANEALYLNSKLGNFGKQNEDELIEKFKRIIGNGTFDEDAKSCANLAKEYSNTKLEELEEWCLGNCFSVEKIELINIIKVKQLFAKIKTIK